MAWTEILAKAAASTSSGGTLRSGRVLLVGDANAGKSTLRRHQQEIQHPQDSQHCTHPQDSTHGQEEARVGAQYSLAVARDASDDPVDTFAHVGLCSTHAPALLDCLPSDLLATVHAVVIVLDIERPWSMLASLRRWLLAIDTTTNNTTSTNDNATNTTDNTSATDINTLPAERNRLRQYLLHCYNANMDAAVAANVHDALPDACLDFDSIRPPIVIVCHKTDAMPRLEQTLAYKEDTFDFIQQMLRVICLKYGAALFYTSKLREESIQRLWEYVNHRIFDTSHFMSQDKATHFPFTHKPNPVDRDALLIPSGWDTLSKIDLQNPSFTASEVGKMSWDQWLRLFEQHVRAPTMHGEAQVKIMVDDEQAFLSALAAVSQETPVEDAATRLAQLSQKVESGSGSITPVSAKSAATSKKLGAPAPGASNEVLANFFQSLLKK